MNTGNRSPGRTLAGGRNNSAHAPERRSTTKLDDHFAEPRQSVPQEVVRAQAAQKYVMRRSSHVMIPPKS